MKHTFISLTLLLFMLNCMSQYKMKPVDELIDTKEPGWDLVKAWIESARNKIEVLPVDTIKAREALFNTQVTSRSPLGAIVLMSGGILVDNGWIRILGSGSPKLQRSIPSWNKGKAFKDSIAEGITYLLIADDAIGGFYIQNVGALGKDVGKIYYLAPDNLEYEALDYTYSEFILFCFNSDLNKFYSPYRWNGWQNDVSNLSGDRTFNFFPPLYTKEGQEMKNVSRRDVPVEEQFLLTLDVREQLGLENKNSH